MERLTERFDNGQVAVMGCGENCKYNYKYCRNHYEDCPEITDYMRGLQSTRTPASPRSRS